MSAETVASGQLRAFIERAERLDEEIAALNADKRDLFAEAKGNGFDVKALKAVLGIRRKDPSERSEHNTLVALYLSTLGMADAADEVEQNDPHAHVQVQVQAHPRAREGDETAIGNGAIWSGSNDEGAPHEDPAETDGAIANVERIGVTVGGDESGTAAVSEVTPGAAPAVQWHDAEPLQATAASHGIATPAAGSMGEADRGGAPPSGPVVKSGVTAGERPGTNSRGGALNLDRASGDDRSPAKPGSSPQPGAGRESPGTLPAEREAAIADRLARARLDLPPLDPTDRLFAIRFKARHLRDPQGEEWATGVPAAATEAA